MRIRRRCLPERKCRSPNGVPNRRSQMRHKTVIVLAIPLMAGWSLKAMADAISLGTAGNYAVLAYMSVTNTGNTVIDGGDVGVSPGTSITGFSPPGTITPPYAI